MSVSGAVWVDQFYDYWDDGSVYSPRPGSNGWEEYMQGYPFNGNVFLDISDFQGKDVIFRIQSRYDENQDGGAGEGLFIDDFRVYKLSGGNYPAPTGLTAEAGDHEVDRRRAGADRGLHTVRGGRERADLRGRVRADD